MQGRRVPAQQHQPPVAMHGDIPQPAPTHFAETEIAMAAHQGIPARRLVGPHQAHLHFAQWDLAIPHFPPYRTSDGELSLPFPKPTSYPLLRTLKKPCKEVDIGHTILILSYLDGLSTWTR